MINLSETAANAMLDELSRLMDGGSIELISDQRVLAVLRLSDPAAMSALGGEIEFNDIAQDIARMKGNATSARVVAADGTEIFSCDVGDENSDAVIRLTSLQINRGAPVLINSFRLGMP
jgi:hypothetical protein